MGTVPSYPPALPFDGSELVAIWQDGSQKQGTLAELATLTVANTDWANVPIPALTAMFNAMQAAGLFASFVGV